MSTYKPGSVSATLFGKKKKKSDASQSFLTELFSSPKCPPTVESGAKLQNVNKKLLQPTLTVTEQKKSGQKKKRVQEISVSNQKENRGKEIKLDETQGKIKKKRQQSEQSVKTKNDKQKLKNVSSDKITSEDASQSENFPFLHETLVSQSKSPKSSPKKRKAETEDDQEEPAKRIRIRNHRHRDKTNDKRTIFIGNCSLSADKKTLKNLFRKFGDIESIRFRCAPAAQLELPRRAIVITKNFHEQSKSFVSFIVFKEEEAAQKALSMNGHLLDGLHLRVDLASQSKQHDKKRSIFIGNLPFDAKEEDLRTHFDDCGDILNVRVIRDRRTSLGKGIAYIQFESKDEVNLALKLDNSEFKGRPLRVRVCSNKPEKIEERKAKKDPKTKKVSKPSPSRSAQEKKPSFAPSNMTAVSFSSVLKIKKDKRLRKIKKKKENAKKSDGLSAIFGDVEKSKKQVKGKKDKRNVKVKDAKGRKKDKSFKEGKRKTQMKGSKKSFRSKQR